MSRCDDFRIQVASSGFDVSHFNRHVKDHLIHCPGCSSFISAIPFFDQSISNLPVYDAPKKLIDNTIAKIVEFDTRQKQLLEGQNDKRINKLAISFTAIAMVGLIYQIQPYFSPDGSEGRFPEKLTHKIMRFPVLTQTNSFLTPSKSGIYTGYAYSNTKNRKKYLQSLIAELSVLQQPTDTLSYQSTFGYWSNTYLAEDVKLHYTATRMRYWNSIGFFQSFGITKALEFFSQPIQQPFEKPKESALAVYLQSDRSEITGPTRMRLQVGIQARDFPLVQSVTKELVARRLSLKINLAAGVKLFSIIGAYPLNNSSPENTTGDINHNHDANGLANTSKKVRKKGFSAQNARDLSLKSGISIIIPKFLAGDSHVILLDVLVDSPGEVAEVSLFYKDLLFHRNGLNQAGLTLINKSVMPEKLQDNVSKNLLAQEISQTLHLSSKLLQNENEQLALEKLVSLKNRLADFRQASPKWRNDKEIMEDEIMLSNFVTAFNSLQLDNEQHQQYLQHALKLAGWRKLGLGQHSNIK